MAFTSLKELLTDAKEQRFAIPQFNINGYLWAESILEVAQSEKSPIIVGVTDKNVKRLGGYSFIREMVNLMIDKWQINVPVVLHLDHGKSVDNCVEAIVSGFSSVMFDGSHLSLDENIRLTSQVVNYAKKYDVSVEGEIGAIGGTEDGITSEIAYANPDDCLRFVVETGIDALAAALGSVHGPYNGIPNLKFDVMAILDRNIQQPLVLHGASGISDEQIKRAIELGHAKINYNTELNLAWAKDIRILLNDQPNVYDPKIILLTEKKALKRVIIEKIQLLKNNKNEGI